MNDTSVTEDRKLPALPNVKNFSTNVSLENSLKLNNVTLDEPAKRDIKDLVVTADLPKIPGFSETLNRDVKKRLKLCANNFISNNLNQWNSYVKYETFLLKDLYVRNLRDPAKIRILPALNAHPETMELQRKAKETFEQYRTKFQGLINQYSHVEYKHYCKVRLDSFRTELLRILKLLFATKAAKRLTELSLSRAGGDTSELEDHRCKITTGFAFLLILTGDACSCIRQWGEFDSNKCMFNRLTDKLTFPHSYKNKRSGCIFIGTKYFKQPNNLEWDIAQTLANMLTKTVAAITFGLSKKLK